MIRPAGRFRRLTLDELRIDDERALRDVPLYPRLKRLLLRDGYRFRVPASATGKGPSARSLDWNRALFLNLSFWSPADPADVLTDERIPADVVAHVALHHLAARALGPLAGSADGLLLGESIASAFDLYLVGRLLSDAPRAAFLASQVPAMAEVAQSAGLSSAAFSSLLSSIAGDPDAAFSSLRALLFTAAATLLRAHDTDHATRLLARFSTHRFHALLHHYNVSNWILSVRAHSDEVPARVAPPIAGIDRSLRKAPVALEWLSRHWLDPAEASPAAKRPRR